MSWLILFFAGLLEIAWAIGLKAHNGRPLLIVGTATSAILSVVLLGIAIKEIPVSTAYVVWTGIGIVGTVLIGATMLGEAMTTAKLVWVVVTVIGIMGLKFASH